MCLYSCEILITSILPIANVCCIRCMDCSGEFSCVLQMRKIVKALPNSFTCACLHVCVAFVIKHKIMEMYNSAFLLSAFYRELINSIFLMRYTKGVYRTLPTQWVCGFANKSTKFHHGLIVLRWKMVIQ